MARRVDPRIEELALSANDQLFDRGVRHAVFLERLKTSEANRIVAFLNDSVIPDLISQIQRRLERAARGHRVSLNSTQRLQKLLREINEITRAWATLARGQLGRELVDIAASEAEFQASLLRQATKGIGISLDSPGLPLIRQALKTRTFQGKTFSTWFRELGVITAGNFAEQVNIGLAQGESIPTIVRRVRGTARSGFNDGAAGKLRRQVTALVRTSVNHATSQAREVLYAENDDLIKGVQYVATLDSRTSDICITLDGRVFPPGDGPRPPQHFNCRSTTTPVLRSWRELGLDLAESPPGTRASMNGQVPATTNYPKWLRRQPRRVQEEVLGKGRAALFRRGRVSIRRFVDDKGKSLTLRELENLEKELNSA